MIRGIYWESWTSAKLGGMKYVAVLFLVMCGIALVLAQSTLNIPDSHPRLYWTAERIARAKSWNNATSFVPTSNVDSGNYIYDQLLKYVVSGDTSQCRIAIDWALAQRVSETQLNGVSSDTARWYGDQIALTYDWCYDQWTPSQKSELIDRWNGYFMTLMAKPWGGLSMPTSNYFWGYFRNELEWGIATKGDNPKAQQFIDFALDSRWTKSFVPYAAAAGRGGVPIEGTQYGPYMVGYVVNPLETMANFGRNLLSETNWYREFVYALIYLTTPAPTARPQDTVKYYQIVPWADCCDRDSDRYYPAAAHAFWDASMRTLAGQYAASTVGRHARQWINKINDPTQSFNYIRAADAGGPATSFGSLPTDYFAAGSGFWSTRSAWDGTGMWVVGQLGDTFRGIGHAHNDAGSFQIWHEGRWLSRESTGYSNYLRSYSGEVVADNTSEAHNTLMFNGVGLASNYADGSPVTLQLESANDHSFIAVDLTPLYRAHSAQDFHDNPYAKSVIRELTFVKPMNTLVVLDRLESQSDVLSGDTVHRSVDAAVVTKTFLLHTELAPVFSGSTMIATSGRSVLRSTTLLPAAPSIRTINEGDIPTPDRGFPYQFRTEIEQTGPAQSYFLHVLQARSVDQTDVVATLTEQADGYTVTLTNPNSGTAVIQFNKGMRSGGGAFGFAASGIPTPAPLNDGVQVMRVTNAGPSWNAASPTRPRK